MPATATLPRISRARLRRMGERGNRYADGWVPILRRHLAGELKREWNEAADVMEAVQPLDSLLPRWERRLRGLELRLGLAMMPPSFRFARKLWFGETKAGRLDLRAKAREVPQSIEAAFEAEPFLAQKARPALEARLRDTITVETSSTRKKIAYWMERFRDSQYTPAQMGRELRKLGIIRSKARADLLARTSTIWNYSEATCMAFRDVGVQVGEWLATADDLTCPFCMDLDGLKFRLGEPILPAGSELVVGGEVLSLPLLVNHSPLHPHCRCAVIPDLEFLHIREAA